MKPAKIYSMRAQTARGFVWKWRSDDHTKTSALAFVAYEDCVADAKQKGYTVPATPAKP